MKILLLFLLAVTCWAQGAERPNILLILADDMGYSDIGGYGGDAQTPNLDRLAANGVRFTQFYNAARCVPTRASLLSGLHPHQAGLGYMSGDWGVDEYCGHLNARCATIAEVLGAAGYHTSQLGKWHLGNRENGVMPWTRGFERSWVRQGKVSYFDPALFSIDGKKWICPDPENFYSTDEMAAQAIGFIDDAHTRKMPFFMYCAFDAAHWPLQAKSEDIEKYRGTFVSKGWKKMRHERARRQRKLGVIPEDLRLSPIDPVAPDWEKVKDKEAWDLKMAVYCAQIDSMDRSIGKIVAHLEQIGQLDNTLVLYLQDNGACAEGIGKNSSIPPGGAESFMAYRLPWANVSNVPFRSYKHFLHEGGIATPLIAHWPKGIQSPGRISDAFGHLVDIMATCVEVSGADYPVMAAPMEGRSLLPILQDGQRDAHPGFCWEHEGNRAVRKGKWKLVSRYENDINYYKKWGYPGKKPRKVEWELYDIEADRTELKDVAAQHPEIVQALEKEYEEWAQRIGVRPFDKIRKQKGSL